MERPEHAALWRIFSIARSRGRRPLGARRQLPFAAVVSADLALAERDPARRGPELRPQPILFRAPDFKFQPASAHGVTAVLHDDARLDVTREFGRKRLQEERERIGRPRRRRSVDAPALDDVGTRRGDRGDENRAQRRDQRRAPKISLHPTAPRSWPSCRRPRARAGDSGTETSRG
jgi:hypothetical protein